MNTNPKAERVLCFGDSNTWGYVSWTDHDRYSAEKRWTGVLQNMLGNEYEIIEEGLNSRTINKDDPRPGKAGCNATNYIIPCLATHDPLDWVVFMLGTNELKHEHGMSSEEIAKAMEEFLLRIINLKSQLRDTRPQVILIAPPLVNEDNAYCQEGNKYLGATGKSKLLPVLYRGIAERMGLKFLDSSLITQTGKDGVHITEDSHARLGKAVALIIMENS